AAVALAFVTGNASAHLSDNDLTAEEPDGWESLHFYTKGDEVSFNGETYTAKVDLPNDSLSPDLNPSQWRARTWKVGETYEEGDASTFNGQNYAALVDDPDPALSPNLNATGWEQERTTVTAGGSLTLAASNTNDVLTDGDAKTATAGAGIALTTLSTDTS